MLGFRNITYEFGKDTNEPITHIIYSIFTRKQCTVTKSFFISPFMYIYIFVVMHIYIYIYTHTHTNIFSQCELVDSF